MSQEGVENVSVGARTAASPAARNVGSLLLGAHHVSILSSAIEATHEFFTQVLGMPLIKKSVNQDTASMYHLYYGDAVGSAGTAVTFFDMPLAARENHGAGGFSLTTLRVNGEEAIRYWLERLAAGGVATSGPTDVGGWTGLLFEDPSGTRLALIDDEGAGPRGVPNQHSDIPKELQIRGLGFSRLTVSELEPAERFLAQGLGLELVRTYQHESSQHGEVAARVYAMSGSGPHAEVHLLANPALRPRRYGSGGVHHLALSVENDDALKVSLDRLAGLGYEVTDLIDRYYFSSGYVTGPEGVIVEIATLGPGFVIDESAAELGQILSLPTSFEPRRSEIEARLRPLDLKSPHS